MSLLKGLKSTNPSQMNKGDPKPASSYPSVDAKEAKQTATTKTPKTLGPRNA